MAITEDHHMASHQVASQESQETMDLLPTANPKVVNLPESRQVESLPPNHQVEIPDIQLITLPPNHQVEIPDIPLMTLQLIILQLITPGAVGTRLTQ
jgi:hypothetical protein